MNNDLKALQTNLDEINRIKQAIKKAILDLPDNPNVKRISEHPRCFTMQASEIFSPNKHGFTDMRIENNASVFYHCFRSQYERICEVVDKSKPDNIIPTLNYLVINGHLPNNYDHFHPQVRANLKNLLA